MMNPFRLLVAVAFLAMAFLPAPGRAAFPRLALKPISLGQIHSPTTITNAGDGSGRIFVCDQPGIIYIIENGSVLPTPFLDISATAANVADRKVIAVTTGYSERGLLGLAFHPGYADPGSPGYRKFYVNYVKPYVAGVDPAPPQTGDPVNAVTVVAEFQVSAGDPTVADPASERRLLLFTQPQSNHNGGMVDFGPEVGPGGERYLYIGTGDGGSQMDNNAGHTGGSSSRPTNNLGNSQDKTRLLGKILRINPLGTNGPGGQYGIPADNPFVGAGGGVREEIWAYGLRNPWRFSWDRRPGGTGRMFCGDVGGDRIEEVDIIVKGGNYGWRYLEGTEMPAFSSGAATNPMPHPGGTMIPPIAQYAHPNVTDAGLPQLGLSVTGGFVYRGSAIPGLQGKYLFGDYGAVASATNGRMMGLEETAPGSGIFTLTQAVPLLGTNPIIGKRILTFGEDEAGEIFVGLKTTQGVLQLGTDGLPAGGIYQVVAEQRITGTFGASQDNTIFSEDTDPDRVAARGYAHASDGRGYIYVGRTGPNYGPYVRRGLIAFDVASRIVNGSAVQSVELQLNFSKSGANGAGTTIELRKLAQTWGEGTSLNTSGGFGAAATTDDATWIYRFFNTSTWSTPGGVFSGTPSAAAVVGSPGLMTWASTPQLVADVQDWVNTPANNAGWLLLGNEVVNVTACEFDSKQRGTTPPKLTVGYDTGNSPIVLSAPGDMVIGIPGTGGAVVNFTATAADPFGGPISVNAVPASGSTFPMGSTVVNLTANDGLGSIATGSFTVTIVQDTTKPVLNLVPVIAAAMGPDGAVVSFTVDVSDNVGVTSLSVNPPSGSLFPLGDTTVNVTAMDSAGNQETGSFTVTVQADTTPPVLMLPAPITAEATSGSGAVVNFNATASDNVGVTSFMVAPPSGSVFPLGQTTVNATASDAAGNQSMGSFTVTVQDTTKPTLTLPGSITAEATGANGAVVDFNVSANDAVGVTNLMVVPPSGSVFPIGQTTVNVMAADAAGNEEMGSFTVTVQDTTAPSVTPPANVTVEATSAAGATVTYADATASDAVGVTSLMYSQASGVVFALGTTMVTVTAKDAANNTGTAMFSVTVQDTTPPAIGGNFPPRTTNVTTLADFTPGVVASDAVGVTSIVQTPAPGSTLALGVTVVTLTARDAAGNETSLDFTVTLHPPEPDNQPQHLTGGAVPGAGSPGGPPAGATFMSFGVPAINDAGQIAFLAKWKSPSGGGSGIFAGNPAVLVAKTGDPAPETVPGVFKAFVDPVIDANGRVAFLATLTGAGVTKNSDTVVVTNAFTGSLQVSAQEGALTTLPGAPKFKSLRDVSLVVGEVLFTATLAGGTPPVRNTNNDAAFRVAASGAAPQLVAREGDALDGSTVKAFRLLNVVTGSPGQNRGHNRGTASFMALLGDGRQALVDSAGGVMTAFLATGDPTGGAVLPGATFATFGPVATDTVRAAFLATFDTGAAQGRGVFLGAGAAFEPVAREGEAAADLAGLTFKTLLDPVLAPGREAVAFPAQLAGAGVTRANDTALFHQPDGGALRSIAREGSEPPSMPGVRWKSFVSLALPAGDTGPIFHATLAGTGVKPGNDAGVWAIDSDGDLVRLFREGDSIDTAAGTKVLKRFTVLNAVHGSSGVTRAFNQTAVVAWRAEFTDGTSGLVVTLVP